MDSFRVPYNIIVKSKDAYIRFVESIIVQDCLCEHPACYHYYEMYHNVNELCDEIAFAQCRLKHCKCGCFKRDNLKYLEKLAIERDA